MKYRTKSADVLNEADRLERIMDWQLFCIEQEKLLYGPTNDRDAEAWRPGDNLHFAPGELSWMIEFDEMFFGEVRFDSDYLSSFGNCVRPVIQTFEWDEDLDGEDFHGDRVQRVISYPSVECKSCGVGWKRDDTCWMCGRTYEYLKPKRVVKFSTPRIIMGDVNLSADGMTFRGTLDISSLVDGVRLSGAALDEVSGRFTDAMRGFSEQFVSYAQVDMDFVRRIWGDVGSYSITAYPNPATSYEMTAPPSNPLRREEREIVLVEPVVPDLPEWSAYRRPRVRLPIDWRSLVRDQNNAIDPRYVPQPLESRDFSDWEYTPYPDATLFERRRR